MTKKWFFTDDSCDTLDLGSITLQNGDDDSDRSYDTKREALNALAARLKYLIE